MDYSDGDSLYENLTHRTHRLPDLTGDMVFNPEVDAESPMVPHHGPDTGAKSGQKCVRKPGSNSDAKPGFKSGSRAGAQLGMALKGQRIEVWWAQDHEFYPGVVTSYKKVHYQFYTEVRLQLYAGLGRSFLLLLLLYQMVGMCTCSTPVCQ